jgi:hypothetical protein
MVKEVAAGYHLHWNWHVMRSQAVEVYAAGFDCQRTNTIVIHFANPLFEYTVESIRTGQPVPVNITHFGD